MAAMTSSMDVDSASSSTPNRMDLIVATSSTVPGSHKALRELYRGPEDVHAYESLLAWRASGQQAAWRAAAQENFKGNPDAAKLPADALVFDVDRFLSPGFCSSEVYGKTLLYGHVLKSTQISLYEHGLAMPEGTVCVTDVQTSGKGRGSNQWTSPPGCLLVTFLSSVREGRTLPLVQYLVCVAIVDAIKSFEGFEDANVGIKWPNDIYADRSTKIGGILCQSVSIGGKFKVCIGMGLNVDNEEPTTCLNAIGKGPRVSREQVLARILEKYDALHEEFEREGFTRRLQDAYERAWLHNGQEVTLQDEGGRKVIIEGISPASGGCLVARDASDASLRFELYPDGNRFDFFQGLISKRM